MRVPESIKDALPVLAYTLGDRLLKVLTQDAPKCASASSQPITVEIYLAALYRSFPDETASFFYQTEPLIKMAEELYPTDLKSAALWSLKNPVNPQSLLRLKIDDQLAGLLLQAAKFSSASGRGRADLADFFGVLSLDDETIVRLHRERNLILKGYIGLIG